ncbi:MAG: CHAT domain-containing protein [Mariprofundaceae bacterium]
MSKDTQNTEAPKTPSGIEEMLRERQRLDIELREQYDQEVTVMFTDIKGSTAYFETYGDLDGRLMVQKHHDMLFPIIESHRGKIIKTIGDAIMASFEQAEDGVLAAMGMQRALHQHNDGKTSAKDQIPVRIGLATGNALVEEKDIYGDIVNLASRVESQADASQILISDETCRKARKHSEIICRKHKTVQVKGKEEPVQLYRVVWGEEELFYGKTRSNADHAHTHEDSTTLILEVVREGDSLKIGISERSAQAESAVRNYQQKTVDGAEVDALSTIICEILQSASKGGKVSNEKLNTLKASGQQLLELLLTAQMVERLRESEPAHLQLRINDELVQIPWEVLYTGEQFLSLKFDMGRIVSTQQTTSDSGIRHLEAPLKMLIVADPTGDLNAARLEGVELERLADSNDDHFHARLEDGGITANELASQIRNFDICHYAGHAHYEAKNGEKSGWRLSDGTIAASDIQKLAGGRLPMPSLVFANACQSGLSESWKLTGERSVYGMANAFLLSGVQHFIGTFMELPDKAGHLFSSCFYGQIGAGRSIGSALRSARIELLDQFGEDSLLWASYLLYGDPGSRYISSHRESKKAEGHKTNEPLETLDTTAQTGNCSKLTAATTPSWVWGIAAIACVALIGVIYSSTQSEKKPQVIVINQEQPAQQADMDQAIKFYRAGSYAEAVPLLQARIASHPNDRMAKSFLRHANRDLELKSSAERQERVDQLVQELLTQQRSKPASSVPVDSWTSRKLAVAILDLQVKGEVPLPEGAVEYIPLGLGEGLQQHERIHLVDRQLLDKVLQELKLGSSEMADPATQLQVGRILSANVLVTGRILAMQKRGQISLRMISSETTEIIGQLRFQFDASSDPFTLVDGLTDQLASKITASFPIRCRILDLEESGRMVLNAGRNVGLKVGMKLGTLDGTSLVEVVRVEDNRAYVTGSPLDKNIRLQAI